MQINHCVLDAFLCCCTIEDTNIGSGTSAVGGCFHEDGGRMAVFEEIVQSNDEVSIVMLFGFCVRVLLQEYGVKHKYIMSIMVQ